MIRINSQTPEPCDPTHVSLGKQTGKQALGNVNGQAAWAPADDKKPEDINCKALARRS